MARDYVTCVKGHYYDPEKFDLCPHCFPNGMMGLGSSDETAPIDSANMAALDETDTVPVEEAFAPAPISVPEPAPGPAPAPVEKLDSDKTVGFDWGGIGGAPEGISVEPVVGWLVCVKGGDFGKSFTLKAGKNFIGRDASVSDVALTGDKAVSREKHAIAVYDPKAGKFFVQPGTSSQLCYLNDSVVLQVMELNDRDRLSIGGSELMFVALCDGKFNWADCEA